MNATTTSAAPAHSSARAVGIALALVIGAAVAGLATGNVIQQVLEDRTSTVVLSQAAVDSMHDMLATDRAAMAAAAAAQNNATNWPDYALRHRAPISDTFRFTGPSRIQAVAALSPALALEAYGNQLVERLQAQSSAQSTALGAALATEFYGNEIVRRQAIAAAEAAQAVENWPDYALRHRDEVSDTFRLTGPSHAE